MNPRVERGFEATPREVDYRYSGGTCHRTTIEISGEPVPDYELVAGAELIDEPGYLGKVVLSVAVGEDDELRMCSLDPSPDCAAIATLCDSNDTPRS